MVDMWPYTEEGLAAAAERPHSHAHAQSSSSQSRDTTQHQLYLYRLRGVVVQSGTEKSGHYYSYIQVSLEEHVNICAPRPLGPAVGRFTHTDCQGNEEFGDLL